MIPEVRIFWIKYLRILTIIVMAQNPRYLPVYFSCWKLSIGFLQVRKMMVALVSEFKNAFIVFCVLIKEILADFWGFCEILLGVVARNKATLLIVSIWNDFKLSFWGNVSYLLSYNERELLSENLWPAQAWSYIAQLQLQIRNASLV